mgnify:FL=1
MHVLCRLLMETYHRKEFNNEINDASIYEIDINCFYYCLYNVYLSFNIHFKVMKKDKHNNLETWTLRKYISYMKICDFKVSTNERKLFDDDPSSIDASLARRLHSLALS